MPKKIGTSNMEYVRLHPDDIKAIAVEIMRLAQEIKRRQKQPKQAVKETYPQAFEQCWAIYPQRPGNNKREAYLCFNARLNEGEAVDNLLAKTTEYRAHCDSSEKTGTQLVLMARTFYGVNRRYNDSWPIEKPKPKTPDWAKLPHVNEELEPFARKHGLQRPGPTDTYQMYRSKLQKEIEEKLNNI